MELEDKQQYKIVLYNGETKEATFYKKYWRRQPPIQKKWLNFETEKINCFVVADEEIINISEVEYISINGELAKLTI